MGGGEGGGGGAVLSIAYRSVNHGVSDVSDGGRGEKLERSAKAEDSAQLIIGLGGVRATESIRLPRVTRGGGKKSGHIRGRIKRVGRLGWWNWINSSARRLVETRKNRVESRFGQEKSNRGVA